jgi:hypothetical protein
MSPSDQREHGCGDDVAAYALGALEPGEARALEAHLATCAVCRDELASLQGGADALSLATPQVAVPRGLRRRVMSAIREEARSAPGSAPREARRLPARGAAFAGALAVAAVLVVAAVLLTGGGGGTRQVQASVSAPGASAVLRLSGGQGMLIVRHMPQPAPGKIYEVWIKRGAAAPTPTSALFGVAANGSAAAAVPGSLRGATAVLVTPEPRGGSPAPTHAPVIVARL